MTKNSIRPALGYIDQLTWLRGIAAFFVIVSHTLRATEVKYSQDDEISRFFFMTLFDLGYFGVVIFFVLSGCALYISNAGDFGFRNLMAFYIKRFFRIWPAFFISLVIYLVFRYLFAFYYVGVQGYWIEGQFLSAYSAADIFRYLSLMFNATGPSGLFNNAYWSLPVEFQYYLIFPLIIASLRFFGVFGPIFIGLVVFIFPKLGIVDFNENAVFTLAFSFCGGVLLGYLYQVRPSDLKVFVSMGLIVLLILVMSAIGNLYIALPDVPVLSGKWNWLVGGAVLLVYLVMNTNFVVQNKRLNSFLKHYGTISFSTYLYHNLFIAIAILFIVNYEIHNGAIRLFLTFIFTLIMTYFLASLSYKYIENPFIALGRAITVRLKSY